MLILSIPVARFEVEHDQFSLFISGRLEVDGRKGREAWHVKLDGPQLLVRRDGLDNWHTAPAADQLSQTVKIYYSKMIKDYKPQPKMAKYVGEYVGPEPDTEV